MIFAEVWHTVASRKWAASKVCRGCNSNQRSKRLYIVIIHPTHSHTLSRIKAHIKNSYLLPGDMSFVQTRTNNQPKTHSRTISDAHKGHYYKLVFRLTAMCFHSPLRDGCLVIWMCCAALEARPSFVSGSHWVSYCVWPLFWPLAALARQTCALL